MFPFIFPTFSQKKSILKSFAGSFLALALSCLGGCNPLKLLEPAPFRVSGVTINALPNANTNSATAVDLVVLYDKEILDVFLGMTADEHFNITSKLQRDHPTGFEVLHWEVVPGQTVHVAPNYKGSNPVAGVVYANYKSPGTHRFRVGLGRQLKITLKEKEFLVTEK